MDRLQTLKADRDRAKAALERAKEHPASQIQIDPAPRRGLADVHELRRGPLYRVFVRLLRLGAQIELTKPFADGMAGCDAAVIHNNPQRPHFPSFSLNAVVPTVSLQGYGMGRVVPVSHGFYWRAGQNKTANTYVIEISI
jgi:hypothetical protein